MKINPYNQSRKSVIGRILSIHTILVLFFPLIIVPRIQSFRSLKFVYRDFPNRQTTIALSFLSYTFLSFGQEVSLAQRARSIPISQSNYTLFVLAVKAEFQQTFYQPLDDMLLHIRIELSVHFRTRTAIPGIMG